MALSNSVKILYFEEEEQIFSLGDRPKDHFFVVKEGAVGLYTNTEDGKLLVNICDEGELFGLRPLVEKDAYKLHAIAKEESMVYAISVEKITEFMATNEALRRFIDASFKVNMAGGEGDVFLTPLHTSIKETFFDHQLIDFSKEPVVAQPKNSIQEAAQLMERNRVGSIIIIEKECPVGIITDKDLRLKVATGKVGIEEPVTSIMSSPVISVPPTITVAEAQIKMLKYKITHLCITENGESNTKLLGLLSEHDIVALRGNNPYSLLKEIRRAQTIEQLAEIRKRLAFLIERYMGQEATMEFLTQVTGAINDALTDKLISICLATQSSPPPVPFAWMALGSQGRDEQLLLTDQDNALVYDDVSEEFQAETKAYFETLSEKVVDGLHTLGYEYCPAEMMASNPKWCLPLSQWKKQFEHWIKQPDEDSIMLCTIFFDFKRVYGEKRLTEDLAAHIFQSISSFDLFLYYLARNAIQNPAPIGFFRQFIVEKDSEHKNEFDLKARALMPLIDAARVLTLSHNIGGVNSTVERYRVLAEKEPHNKELFESCEEAFKELLRIRVEQGLRDDDSGRYLELESLNKFEKLQLRACFRPLKDIQEVLKVRFKLAQIL